MDQDSSHLSLLSAVYWLGSYGAPRVTLASILASLNIASAQHVLLDSVGFFRHCINVVQAATGFTADEWYLKLLQRPRGLEAH